MQRNYQKYRGVYSGNNGASRETAADNVCLKEPVEQEWLWDQAADTVNVAEETLSSARRLIQAECHVASATKKGCLELIRDLARELQAVSWGTEAMTEKLAEQEATLSKPDLKLQRLNEENGRVGNLWKGLVAKAGKL